MEWLGVAIGFLGVLFGVGLAALVTQAAFAGLERAARRRQPVDRATGARLDRI